MLSLNLSNCGGDDEILETPNKYFMFKGENISQQVLHNIKDKLIYMFTYSFEDNNPTDLKIIAYNYEQKKVIKTNELNFFKYNAGAIYSIGDFNNKTELYVLSKNTIYILSGDTLNEIASINIPDADMIYSIQSKSGLLFISYNNTNYNNKLVVYGRESLQLINNEITNSPHQGIIVVYYDKLNNNEIKCASFPQSSNDWKFQEYTFDTNGNYLSFDIGTNEGEGKIIRTNDNSNFILNGRFGRVHLKEDLMNNETILNNNGDLVDFKISLEGDFIYSIQNDYKINIYDTSDFSLKESISINQIGSNIFIDGDKLIIIDYDSFSNPVNVYLSIYQN